MDEKAEARGEDALRSRMNALIGFWEALGDCRHSAPECSLAGNEHGLSPRKELSARDCRRREIFRPFHTPTTAIAPPPPYEEALSDAPPDYTTTNERAVARFSREGDLKESNGETQQLGAHPAPSPNDAKVDPSEIAGIRSAASKKAKQAAKKAQMEKWADSDNENGQSGGGDGGENGGEGNNGGEGGAGAGGDGGGDPPDGNGGDDGDDWFTGWGSSKKDKKKKKKGWFDDDEDTKKAEEEAAKKAEEDAAAAAASKATADADDDWAGFSTAKSKKKGKKNKEPDPEPEPTPSKDSLDLGTAAQAVDANAEDEWGGFSSKKKKGKKGKVRDYSTVSFPIMTMCERRVLHEYARRECAAPIAWLGGKGGSGESSDLRNLTPSQPRRGSQEPAGSQATRDLLLA